MKLYGLALLMIPCAASAAEREAPAPEIRENAVGLQQQAQIPRLELPAAPLNASLSAPEVPVALSPSLAQAPANLTAPKASPIGGPIAILPAAAIGAVAHDDNSAPATGFGAKVKSILARIVNPFGTSKEEGQSKPLSPAEEGYARFKKEDFWAKTAEPTRAEIEKLRALKSKAEAQAYVRKAGQEILARLQAKHGTENLGFHFNLHGGTAEGYVQGGGIRATMGDIANNYTMHGDKNLKVYFFQSKNVPLYDVLNESNPAMLMFPSRMGGVLSVFRLDSPELKAAMADGRIKNFGNISMDFHGMRGVPYSSYIAPPIEVFHGTAKKLGVKGRLSRDEETLAVMRYLEAVALSDERFVP